MCRYLRMRKRPATEGEYREPGFILTNVKIFQFSHSTCRIIGQHALCGKEKLIVSEYKLNLYDPNICLPGIPIRRGRENTMLVSITSGGESIWGNRIF